MILVRIARVIAHLLYGLALCALVFPFSKAPRQQAVVRRWSAGLLKLCDVEVRLRDESGAPLAALPAADAPALVVSNHISWLDIFAINAVRPCHFVAKADIRSWPLIGWLCAISGTLFIARGQKSALRDIQRRIVASLRAGERIAFFPEGTTAAQGELLPFHSNLFECAIEAQVPVQPYALRYLCPAGQPSPEVEFVGETTFVQSMVGILRAGRIVVEVTALPALPTQIQQRRALADAARQGIAATLERLPPAGGAACAEKQPAPVSTAAVDLHEDAPLPESSFTQPGPRSAARQERKAAG